MAVTPDTPTLVKALRTARGLTQEQLAHELGVTFSTVNGWENGKHVPIPLLRRRLLELAVEAGVHVDTLPRGGDGAPVSESRRKSTRRG